MNVKNHFNELNEKIDNMSNEEFMQALRNAGLEECPDKNDKYTTYNLNAADNIFLSKFFNIKEEYHKVKHNPKISSEIKYNSNEDEKKIKYNCTNIKSSFSVEKVA